MFFRHFTPLWRAPNTRKIIPLKRTRAIRETSGPGFIGDNTWETTFHLASGILEVRLRRLLFLFHLIKNQYNETKVLTLRRLYGIVLLFQNIHKGE